jgi:lytic murein transglycosylase
VLFVQNVLNPESQINMREIMLENRPSHRHGTVVVAALLMLTALVSPSRAADTAFQKWLADVWPDAQAMGISRATFDNATKDLTPNLSLPDLVIAGRSETPQIEQAEFLKTPEDYLSDKQLTRLTETGRKLAEQHRAALAAIEKRFGVPGPVVLAIWGRETNFGDYKLPHDALQVLATLAYTGKRKDKFREEFLYAMKLLEDGRAKREDMRSSWAGAMGMTQFLPSEIYKFAVDQDGDGRADLWRSVPDALASAAKQLEGKGWQPGKRWAYEVSIPKNVDCSIAEPDQKAPLKTWLQQGYKPLFNRKPSAEELSDDASLLLPAGIYGPAFLVSKNYFVIKDYNFSDLYVLFVGSLSDRISEGHGFHVPWGKVGQMRSKELAEMQERLTKLGLYHDKIDGKAGMKTRAALGVFQKANNLKLDCWPNVATLNAIRAKTK